ncbi:MAG: helix-turn-helix domain-containing protein [Christensenellaceae bacterium]|jgi:mannose-6-phosphate isomerase-like protein (cupin superfamily)
MENHINEVAERIKALREIEEIPVMEMAEATEKTEAEYLQYENGERDFSFSFLFTVANKLGVDITELLTGENTRLKKYSLVKNGKGLKMERRKAYKYQHLAPVFSNRHMEPFMVTVEPKDDEAVKKHAHEGQEMNYVVEGQMTIFIGDAEMYIEEGDTVYFDATVPHAMRAENGKPCRYLAIISK